MRALSSGFVAQLANVDAALWTYLYITLLHILVDARNRVRVL